MNYTYGQTLCWDCEKSTNSGCSWSKGFKPVKGWEAERRPLKIAAKRKIESYMVVKCPEFKADERRKK